MRTQIRSQKSQNKLLFCTLCGFIATSENELDQHYRMSHDPDPDVEAELEIAFENKKINQKKPKTLKEKALRQLKLLIEGKLVHHEYYGTCEVPYYLTTKKCGNVIKIKLEQGMWIC